MPVRQGAPSTLRYVGPLLWDADIPLPSWYSGLERGRPTVYFTMGSTGDARFFEEAVRVFGGTGYQVLITTGGLAEIKDAPSNVLSAKYAPGDALMRVSDVVVSHGGNGTIYQALSRGVPVIGLPTIFDQEINMRRVTALGVGLRISSHGYVGGDVLAEAVRTVVGDPGYRERARGLARSIAATDGPRTAALHVHDFLEHGDPSRCPGPAGT
jgi:UDP:flavonoid glycosyltransferase YjiC (YdhE family)